MTEEKFSPWKYFTLAEVKCKCGQCGDTGYKMDDAFMRKLDALREILGFPLVITSGYRCPAYNKKVSNTGNFGPHTTGKAVDIAVDRLKAYQLVKAVLELGFTGIGINQKGNGRYIHLDTLTQEENLPRPTIWSY